VDAVSGAAAPKGLRVEDSNKNAVALFRLTHSYFGSLHIMPRKRFGKRLPEKQTAVSATHADARRLAAVWGNGEVV